MRAQMLDGVEKLGFALSWGGEERRRRQAGGSRQYSSGHNPGKDPPPRCSCFAEAGGIRLRATIGEQEIEKEIIAELILLRDLRDALLNFSDAKGSHLGFVLSAKTLWLEFR